MAAVKGLDWPYAGAAILAVAALSEVVARPGSQPSGLTLALVLALAVTVPLAMARAQPDASAAIIAVATVVTLLSDYQPPVAGGVALVVTAFLVGGRGSRWVALSLVAMFVVYALPGDTDERPGGRELAIALLTLTTAAVGSGTLLRARDEAARRAASEQQIADTLFEHAARGERARIAQELHDVVAHHISMIAVQAEAARLTTAGMPPEGAQRLVTIGDTARSALTEMRRLLGVLREDAEPAEAAHDGDTRAHTRPQPGLQQLNELMDEARGLSAASTRLIVRGRVTALTPGVELTAYRIVQEALTNARRHASGAAVDVELDYRGDALHVVVRDNGPGPPDQPGEPGSTGHGITGMHERAAMVGGWLKTGPAPLGGFLVDALLPIAETEP